MIAQIDNPISSKPLPSERLVILTEPGNHKRIISYTDTEIELFPIVLDKAKHRQQLIDIANAILQAVQ
jgi:hypothetical protein